MRLIESRGQGAFSTLESSKPAHGALESRISMSRLQRALSHTVDAVKRGDKEKYLANLCAPPNARAALFAVQAFNLELANIRTKTSEANTANLRFQWWRKALEQAQSGNPPNHPVALALSSAMQHHKLTTRYLEQMIEAREADISITQPETLDDLLLYCEQTSGAMLLLGMESVGSHGDSTTEQAATLAGVTCALATLLRGFAFHVSQDNCTYIPAEIARTHSLSLKSILSGKHSAELSGAMAELSGIARTHLLSARSLQSQLPAACRSVLLPVTSSELVLRHLESIGYNPYVMSRSTLSSFSLVGTLAWHSFRGSY